MNTLLKLTDPEPLPYQRVDTVPNETAELGWSDILLLLRRRVLRVIGVTFLVCLAALPVILSQPKLYYAETQVLLRPSPAMNLASPLEEEAGAVDVLTELERLVSYPVMTEVIERFDLDERSEFNAALRPKSLPDELSETVRARLASLAGTAVDPATPDASSDGVRRAFRNALAVWRQGLTDVITVGFTSHDPDLAVAVPTALVESHQQRNAASWQAGVAAASDWLDARITAGQTRVIDSRAALDRFIETDNSASGDTTDTISTQISLLQARRSKIAEDLGNLTSIRRSVETAIAAPRLQALDEPAHLQDLRRELRQQLREYGDLAAIYGENHSGLTVHQNHISGTEADIATELAAYDDTLVLRRNVLETEREDLSRDIEALHADLRDLQRHQPELDRLTTTLELRQEELTAYQSRRNDLQSLAQMLPVTFEVLSPPTRPVDPLGRSRKVYLMFVAVAGLLLGLLAAGIKELRDQSVRSPAQLVHLSRLTPVGLVPAVGRRALRRVDPIDPEPAAAPAIDALEDALFMMKCEGGGRYPRVLVVTATRQNDAAIPVAAWMAQLLAARGTPVWLIDFDNARASAPARCSFAEENVAHVSLPSALLRHGKLTARLATYEALARDAKGMVLIDAPPLHLTRSLDLVRSAGAVLMVLRWGATPRPLVELLAGLLDRLGALQSYALIVGVNPKRHRLYGFRDRLSLTRAASSASSPVT